MKETALWPTIPCIESCLPQVSSKLDVNTNRRVLECCCAVSISPPQGNNFNLLASSILTLICSNFAAWEDVYSRWKVATESFLTTEEEQRKRGVVKTEKTPAEVQQWQNYLGFLVGLSGVTLNRDTTVKVPLEDPKKRTKGTISTEKTVKVIDSFIIELMELLVVDNLLVRETVMNLVGSSLSPASYCIFFAQILSGCYLIRT